LGPAAEGAEAVNDDPETTVKWIDRAVSTTSLPQAVAWLTGQVFRRGSPPPSAASLRREGHHEFGTLVVVSVPEMVQNAPVGKPLQVTLPPGLSICSTSALSSGSRDAFSRCEILTVLYKIALTVRGESRPAARSWPQGSARRSLLMSP